MGSHEQGRWKPRPKSKSPGLAERPQQPGDRPISHRIARAYLVIEEAKALCDLDHGWTELHHEDHDGETPLENAAIGGVVPHKQPLSLSSWVRSLSEPHTPSNERLDSRSRFAKKPKSSPSKSLYLTVLNECFKPERLTKLEKKVRERTLEAVRKMKRHIEEAQKRQERLLQDTRQLRREKSQVEDENDYFLEFLSKTNEQCRKKHKELWKQYFQECGDIEERRGELAFRYAQQTEHLQAQLLQGRKIQAHLREQLKSLKQISLIKEKQEMKIQMLQKEKEKIKAETIAKDREAHLQFLQKKALLDKELQELDMLRRKKGHSMELKRKIQTSELIAQKIHSKFCLGVKRKNQKLWKELQQLMQECNKLEAAKSQLEKQKQQLKEDQWYGEALIRGRRRPQAESHCAYSQRPKGQATPRPH